MIPPRLVRRTVTLPLVVALEVLLLVCAPVELFVAAAISLATWSDAPVRRTAFVLAYARTELWALARLQALTSAGAPRAAYDELIAGFLTRLAGAANRVLDVRLVLGEGCASVAEVASAGPLVVACRHAGPGDSFLLAQLLACHYGRRLRVVAKQSLRLEPGIDLVADHVPLAFVHRRGGAAEAITEMAAGLEPDAAVLLFPEGGNFSRRRRRSRIRVLRRRGDARAALARRLRHTLPPHATGVSLALRARADMGVAVVAHTGFTVRGDERRLWQLPVHQDIRVHLSVTPALDRPVDQEGIARWLDDRWLELDEWVETAGPTAG